MSSARFIQCSICSNLQKHFYKIILGITKLNLSLTRSKGTLAQLVEQRTEKPIFHVTIPGGTTQSPHSHEGFCFKSILEFYYIYSTSKNQ